MCGCPDRRWKASKSWLRYLVAYEATDLNDITLHVVLQNLQRLRGWHTARQELDQIPAPAAVINVGRGLVRSLIRSLRQQQ